MKINIHRT